MPRYTFPYYQFSIDPSRPFPQGQVVYRPLMVATLTASTGRTFRCIVWPDSGADHCVFPLTFALALGLNPLQMQSTHTTGVGNTGNITYYEQIHIELEQGIEIDVYAGFTQGLEAQGVGLLGQCGFFDKFAVAFDHRRKQFSIDTD